MTMEDPEEDGEWREEGSKSSPEPEIAMTVTSWAAHKESWFGQKFIL